MILCIRVQCHKPLAQWPAGAWYCRPQALLVIKWIWCFTFSGGRSCLLESWCLWKDRRFRHSKQPVIGHCAEVGAFTWPWALGCRGEMSCPLSQFRVVDLDRSPLVHNIPKRVLLMAHDLDVIDGEPMTSRGFLYIFYCSCMFWDWVMMPN